LLLLARVRQRQGETPAALELERQARTILRHTGQSGQLDRRDGEENFVERESGVRLQPVWLKSEERDGVSE
jgi:hypothetical protein